MKILVLGSTGFIGRNLVDILSSQFTLINASRQISNSAFAYFDLQDVNSWQNISNVHPDLIINASAYGVIKNEVDLETMYNTNYLSIADFYTFFQKDNPTSFWIQLGTAFEYALSVVGGLTEESACLPRTHYGISKLMFTNFLLEKAPTKQFSVFRPFGMFGKYEDESKFFPMLIKAQQERRSIKLSAGTQQRDYFFACDLGNFIERLIIQNKLNKLPSILNLGAGEAKSFRTYADALSKSIVNFDASLWQWGELNFRMNESAKFFNASHKAKELGFETSDVEEGFSKTMHYYSSDEFKR